MLNGYFGALEADPESDGADDDVREQPQAGRQSTAPDIEQQDDQCNGHAKSEEKQIDSVGPAS